MKNKLIFRILGALASALIIVSVFVPFISVTGYSPSLWETYELTNSLYLPIMIIVFGAIGVIFFALNVKTEFAYMSVGAILFFAIMQTIDILDQGVFNTLSIGYYFLVIGALLTGLMAFLTNLKSKKKVEIVEETKKEDASVLDQIDKLYNEQQTSEGEIAPIQPVDTIVQPLPIQPLDIAVPVEPIVEANVVEEVSINSVAEEIQPQNIEVIQEPVVEQVQVESQQFPVTEEFSTPIIEEVKEVTVVDQQPITETPTVQMVNPVLQEFGVASVPIKQEEPIEVEQTTNTLSQQFNVPVVEEPKVEEPPVVDQQPIIETPVVQPVNPVLQEFGILSTPTVDQQPVLEPQLNQDFKNSVFSQNLEQPSTEVDIFGQPISKS